MEVNAEGPNTTAQNQALCLSLGCWFIATSTRSMRRSKPCIETWILNVHSS